MYPRWKIDVDLGNTSKVDANFLRIKIMTPLKKKNTQKTPLDLCTINRDIWLKLSCLTVYPVQTLQIIVSTL